MARGKTQVKASRNAVMEALAGTIAKLEGRVTGFETGHHTPARSFDSAGQTLEPWRLGTDTLDRYLPQGLALRGVHDITPEASIFTPAASLFAQCLVQRFVLGTKRPGPVAYVQVEAAAREHGRPYGPGLCQPVIADSGAHLGSLAGRLISIRVHHQRDLAQTLEDAVRTQGLAAVIGEGAALPFKVTKRLDRASQASGVPALIVHACGTREASAASTRWMLRPARGPGDRDDPQAPGAPSFHLRLSRIRGPSSAQFACPGDDRIFHVLWNPATLAFDLVSPLRHGQASVDGTQGQKVSAEPISTDGSVRGPDRQWKRAG